MTEKQSKRAMDALHGWLSVPRTTDGLTGPEKTYMAGFLAAISKVNEIIRDECGQP